MYFSSKVNLKKGWNLVNFSLENISLNEVIKNTNIIEIKNLEESYNINIPKEFNSLKVLNPTSGYWIKSKAETIIEISGRCIKSKVKISLNKGWNLMGYPYQIKSDYNNLKKMESIVEVKNLTDTYNNKLPDNFNTLKYLDANCAYWIKSEENKIIEFDYPFEYNQVEDNKINGIITIDTVEIESKESFLKEYKLKYFNISNSKKYESNFELDDNILDKNLKNFRFSVYYDKNNIIKAVELNNFELFDNFEGRICLLESKQNILKIDFIDMIDSGIVIDFNKKYIEIIETDNYLKISDLNISELESLESKTIKSYFLVDYQLNSIIINNFILIRDNKQIRIKNIESEILSNNQSMKISLVTEENDTFIFNLKNEDNIGKTSNIEFLDNNFKVHKITTSILKNELIDIYVKSNSNLIHYEFGFNWEGLLISDFTKVNKFEENTKYLYWYNLSDIDFKIQPFTKSHIVNSNKDFIIFKKDDLEFYLLKSIEYVGCMKLIIIKNKKLLINKVIPLYLNSRIIVGEYNFLINWENGSFDSDYVIKYSDLPEQRDVNEELNATSVIDSQDIAFMIHYFIGEGEKSVDLSVFDSYSNYINIISSIINHTLTFCKTNNIEINFQTSIYHIYVTNLENKIVKDKNGTFIILSSKNNFDELKKVIYYMLFEVVILSGNIKIDNWLKTNIQLTLIYFLNGDIFINDINDFIYFKTFPIEEKYNDTKKDSGSYLYFIFLVNKYGLKLLSDIIKRSKSMKTLHSINYEIINIDNKSSFVDSYIDFWFNMIRLDNMKNIISTIPDDPKNKNFGLQNYLKFDNFYYNVDKFGDYYFKINRTGTTILKINIEGNDNIGVRIKGIINIDDIQSKVLYLNNDNCFTSQQTYDYDYSITKYESVDQYFIVLVGNIDLKSKEINICFSKKKSIEDILDKKLVEFQIKVLNVLNV